MLDLDGDVMLLVTCLTRVCEEWAWETGYNMSQFDAVFWGVEQILGGDILAPKVLNLLHKLERDS